MRRNAAISFIACSTLAGIAAAPWLVALISLAAAATAAWSLAYLTDLGWLLSFLAFFGILVLAPAVESRLGSPKPIIIRPLIESLAAQLLTLPLILYAFGQLSIVAPLANLLIGFITNLIGSFAALPWAGTTQYIPIPVMLGLYALVLVAILVITRANHTINLRRPRTSDALPKW